MPSVAPGTPGEEPLRGFGNQNNKYMWRFGVVDGRLHVGTFDVGTGLAVLGSIPGTPIVPDPARSRRGRLFLGGLALPLG